MIVPLEDVPDILYKYRDWDKEKHKRLLTHQELYFASIEEFNDPFDGTVPHRYNPEQLTEENIFLKYLSVTRKEHPDWSEEQVHAECYEYQRRGYFHDENYLAHFDDFNQKQLNDEFGIACLGKKPDNFLMWSHYCNSHKGFVIGFEKHKLFEDTQCQFAHMQYQEELPLLDLFETPVNYFAKLIGTKSTTWSYEKEYRLSKAHFAKQIAALRPATIVEVFMGCKMSQEEKFKIEKIMSEQYPHARLFDSKLSKQKFEVTVFQIR